MGVQSSECLQGPACRNKKHARTAQHTRTCTQHKFISAVTFFTHARTMLPEYSRPSGSRHGPRGAPPHHHITPATIQSLNTTIIAITTNASLPTKMTIHHHSFQLIYTNTHESVCILGETGGQRRSWSWYARRAAIHFFQWRAQLDSFLFVFVVLK